MLYYSEKLHQFYPTEEAAFKAERNMSDAEDSKCNPKDVLHLIEDIVYPLQYHNWHYTIVRDSDDFGASIIHIDLVYPV